MCSDQPAAANHHTQIRTCFYWFSADIKATKLKLEVSLEESHEVRLETEQNQLIQCSGNNGTTNRKCYLRQEVDGPELNKQTRRFAHTHTEHHGPLRTRQEKGDRKGVFH